MTKTCSICKIEKDLSEFNKHKQDGYRSMCKPCNSRYNSTEKYKENRRKYMALRRKSGYEIVRRKAHNAISNLIKAGKLIRQKCHCGLLGQAHHPDYYKPKEVIWLCVKHHRELHHKAKAETV